MDKSVLEHLPKAVKAKEDIKEKIIGGVFGKPGSYFISVRKLTKYTGVSLVTAQRIVTMLKEDGFLELKGGRHVITKKASRRSNAPSQNNTRKNLIGMLVTNIENPFFATLARETEQAAKEKGIRLMIANSNYDTEREKQALRMFHDSGVRGIISCPSTNKKTAEIYSSLNIPFVLLGRRLPDLEADTVTVENFNAATMVSKHFIDKGYKNFAYFGIKTLNTDRRMDGFKYGLEQNGFSLDKKNIYKTAEMNFTEISVDLLKFIDSLPKPAAVFCFHDLLALLLIKACAGLKIEIPETLAAAGFDNLPFTSKTTPSITTVGYPLKSMASLALNRLLDKTSEPDGRNSEPVNFSVEPELLIRQSSSITPEIISHDIISKDLIYQAS